MRTHLAILPLIPSPSPPSFTRDKGTDEEADARILAFRESQVMRHPNSHKLRTAWKFSVAAVAVAVASVAAATTLRVCQRSIKTILSFFLFTAFSGYLSNSNAKRVRFADDASCGYFWILTISRLWSRQGRESERRNERPTESTRDSFPERVHCVAG